MAVKKILIIDDDLDICMLLSRFLTKKGYDTRQASTGANGIQALKKNGADVVLCDFRLPDSNGEEVLKQIKVISPSTQVIIITGYSDVKTAVKVVKMGAFEYVTKPIHHEEILLSISNALNASVTTTGSLTSANSKSKSEKFEYVTGSSSQSRQIEKLIQLVAPTDMTVVVLGESGTGKEIAANAIHNKSKRNGKPFVAIDCGALPAELAGSELFGHEKGAFTGASIDKTGYFEVANSGTLFLDEVGNLSYENQIKLLRVLQERTIRKVGGNKDIKVDVRIIAATNEDLKTAVRNGSFREDLYYRLNEFKIELPALRERKSDIKEFTHFFLQKANKELQKQINGFERSTMEKLENYYWHGNLRELQNVVKRAVLLSSGSKVQMNCLPQEIIAGMSEDFNNVNASDKIFIPDDAEDLKTIVEHAEKIAIINALEKTNYNKTKTAKLLKVDRKTLYNKLHAYDIKLKNQTTEIW